MSTRWPKEIEAAGGAALALPADVADVDALPALVERTVDELGRLDIVVNNAGGGLEWHPFLETSVEQLERAFHFTVSSPFRLCQLAVPISSNAPAPTSSTSGR
jgi:7-alpha-hydroxysteroid dehydrogenase